jgi:hypothetical protein
LEGIVVNSRLRGLDQESVHRWVHIARWLGLEHLSPVAFEPGEIELVNDVERYDFAMLPSEPPVNGTTVEPLPTEYPYRASLVRVMPGCPLSAISAFRDYERRFANEQRAMLPFLDPVDRIAAQHEDRFASFDIPRGGLSPAIRAYFQDRELFRAFAIAYALDMLSMQATTRSDALFISGQPLSDGTAEASYPILSQALDNYIVRGRATDSSVFDRAVQIASVEQALSATDQTTLKQIAHRIEDRQASWLKVCPPTIRSDFLRVVRMFLEIEIERRNLAVSEGAV